MCLRLRSAASHERPARAPHTSAISGSARKNQALSLSPTRKRGPHCILACASGSTICHTITAMNLTQPVVLITGAGSGIGRALAVLLAQQGHAIAAVDI